MISIQSLPAQRSTTEAFCQGDFAVVNRTFTFCGDGCNNARRTSIRPNSYDVVGISAKAQAGRRSRRSVGPRASSHPVTGKINANAI